MEITKELRQLAKFSEPTFPVISVYVGIPGPEQSQHAENTAFLARHLRRAHALELASDAARQSLGRDLERIEQWATTQLSETAQADAVCVALFTCSGADVWVEFPSPIPFENEFTIADRPALRQLARLDADYTTTLVVRLEAQTARVWEVVLGGFLTETYFSRNPTTQASRKGQLRYRRQARDDLDRHYEEVASYVTAYCAERPETYLILSGQQEVLGRFRQRLRPRAQHKIIDTIALDQRDTHDRILQVARATLEQHERTEDQETVQILLDSAARGGLGVLGVPDTLVAVNTGLVHRLVISSDFQRPGWRCQDCDYIGYGEQVPPQCTICNGLVKAMELGEAMVTEVLRHDGFVEPVVPDTSLVTHGGIGALLRHW